jgi:alkanesulfonate monooxygenase SsuD/methylene tetrahydromethanopterin reductase-like flavin-dependent oxidoreductase (luciferase family)
MRVGLYLNPQSRGIDDDGPLIRDLLLQADLAAAEGFVSIWLTEHHFTGYNAYSDPIVLATALSQRVPLDLGFSIAIAPLHHPIRFVEQVNLLDQLSQGRLTVGIAPGNSPVEFQGFGRDHTERHAMLEEFLAVARQAWAAPEGGFRYDGVYWQGEVKGRVMPAPFQRPHPPLAQGTTTMVTVERIGRDGIAWLIASSFESPKLVPYLQRYAAGMAAAGLDEASKLAQLQRSGYVIKIHLTEDGEDWRDAVGDHVDFFVRRNLWANFGIREDAISEEQYRQNLEFFHRGFFAGTSQQLIELLTPYAQLGIGNLMCWLNFGRIPDHLVQRTIRKLGREVLPALAQVAPAPDLFERLALRDDAPRQVWKRLDDGYAWVEEGSVLEGSV